MMTEHMPLLRDKTLKELKDEIEDGTRSTGCYAGLSELSHKEKDPITYELFHARLLACALAAREVTRMISASPAVRDISELLVSIYTPDGDCIVQSTGIQVHTLTMGRAIKWMIDQNYEELVGIRPGDVFTCNDNAIAGMHPADVYDMMPVFYQDELVAWACTCIMELDIGAVSTSAAPTAANVERYSDGLRFCCEKTGEKYMLRRDVELAMERKVRMPEMFLLDRKGAIAADIHVARETVRIIEEFGIDYFKRTCRELIEDERRGHLARMRERTVPGRYRNPVCMDILMKDSIALPYARRDVLRLMPLEMKILPSGRGVINLDGAGAWGWHSMNCTPSALEGGLSIVLVQTLSYEGTANAGTLLSWDVHVPHDTILDPSKIVHLPTACIWAPTIAINAIWLCLISRAFYSRGFREEILLAQPTTSVCMMTGFNSLGKIFVGASSGIAGGPGSGSRGVLDGIDTGMQIWNTEADIGCSELWEMACPIMEIGKAISPDSGGFGKYRGGNDLTVTSLIHGCDFAVCEAVGLTNHWKTIPSTGIFGGYPGPVGYWHMITDSNVGALIEQGQPLIHEEGDPKSPNAKMYLKGQYEMVRSYLMREVKDGDMVQTIYHSANGGYGDPLERDLSLIKRDLDNGLTTAETCRNIYCAEVSFDPLEETWHIDETKTKELRKKRRQERLRRGIPVKDWWKTQRQRLLKGELDPMVLEGFAGSLRLGESWSQEFRQFWALDEEFTT